MSSLYNNHFYHQTIKRFLVAFGELFEGLSIIKRDENGNRLQDYPVEIEYGPKNKWISRQREQPDLTAQQVQITLPRMSYEIVDIQYDPTRKVGVNGSYAVGSIGNMRSKIFNPVPYDVIIQLRSYTKDQQHSQQIMEQIVPFFQPYLSLNFEILPEFKIFKDVPILLQSYEQVDTYDTSPEELRIVQQTFTFSAQMDFFGPLIGSTGVIKDIIISLSEDKTFSTDTVEIEIKVDPITANKNDTYIIVENIKEMI